MRSRIFRLVTLYLVFCTLLANAQLVKPFTEEEVGSGWSNPVLITFDENGRGYVVERHGLVWLLDQEGNKSLEPFIDIREEVAMFGDHGLLGFAVDPLFNTNHHVYLLYVVDRHHLLFHGTPDYDPNTTIIEQATIGRVTRYTADESTGYTTVDPDSRKVLVGATIDSGFPVLMASHGVGSLEFGTDGTLLASCGEAGSFLSSDKGSAPETYFEQALEDGIIKPKENIGSFRSQLVDCLSGKVIRIDPETGLGIPSNPFYDASNPNAAGSKVWTLGNRQPYRFFLRPGTGSHNPEDGDPGDIYIGDVGGGRYEELNIAYEGGMNFGWPVYEGYERAWPFQDPNVLNVDEPNPLAGGGCPPFFSFLSLVQQPLETGAPFFPNPCAPEQAISSNTRHFVHAIPAMSWSNEQYNKPTRAYVPAWNTNGTLRPVDLSSPDASVDGQNFEGSSVMPGFFYEGEQYPEEYRGKLFIGDFTGWIRVFDVNDEHRITAVDTFHTGVGRIVDLALNPVTGFVYYVNFFDKVYRINFGGNARPSAVIDVDQKFGPGPLEVQFSAVNSSDPNGDPLSYSWDFGDGTSGEDVTLSHTFAAEGGVPVRYDVVLTVTDTADAVRTASVVISVDNTPPDVKISSITNGQLYTQTGMNAIPLTAEVSDQEHGEEDLSYSWQVFLHHNDHFHPEFPVEEKEAHVALPPTGCGGETYYYRVALTVTDGAGLEGNDEVYLYPYCGDPIITELIVTATPESERVNLDWTFTSGDSIIAFEIERAAKFGFFEKIGEVSSDQQAFNDNFPLTGESVYRIKAVHENDLYAYSNNVDIDLDKVDYSEPYLIYPNPVDGDRLNIFMPRTESTSVTFELYTASGQQVFRRIWANPSPEDTLEENVDVANYIPGMYYFVIRDGDKKHRGAVAVVR